MSITLIVLILILVSFMIFIIINNNKCNKNTSYYGKKEKITEDKLSIKSNDENTYEGSENIFKGGKPAGGHAIKIFKGGKPAGGHAIKIFKG